MPAQPRPGTGPATAGRALRSRPLAARIAAPGHGRGGRPGQSAGRPGAEIADPANVCIAAPGARAQGRAGDGWLGGWALILEFRLRRAGRPGRAAEGRVWSRDGPGSTGCRTSWLG